ncbi:hypothetical protein JCM15519_22330 [Fundidesulfovibrio butyratiphilus]
MGGGGGGGHFSGTKGASDWNPFSLGTVYAQAGNGNVATDAGGKAAPAIKPWDKEKAIQRLDEKAGSESKHRCAEYVGKAIEAGGITLNRALNSEGKNACGYGPILKDAGFKTVPEGTPPQKGDVVVFSKSSRNKSGHVAMYDGEKWVSDYTQDTMYPNRWTKEQKIPYAIYRRP